MSRVVMVAVLALLARPVFAQTAAPAVDPHAGHEMDQAAPAQPAAARNPKRRHTCTRPNSSLIFREAQRKLSDHGNCRGRET